MADDHDNPHSRAGALREAAGPAAAHRDDDADALDDTAALEETVADEEVAGEGDLSPGEDADPAYDNLVAHDIVGLGEVDPEAGRMGVAMRVRQARKAARTPGGRLLISIPFALAGIALSIVALVHQTTPLLIAAGVVAPVTIAAAVICYRHWLGHKRYAYRLLESLGEDVSDFTPEQIYRAAGRLKRRLRR